MEVWPGGMGKAVTTFLKILSSMLSKKSDVPYSTTIRWAQCRFSLLCYGHPSCHDQSEVYYIPGHLSTGQAKEVLFEPIEVQVAEGHS